MTRNRIPLLIFLSLTAACQTAAPPLPPLPTAAAPFPPTSTAVPLVQSTATLTPPPPSPTVTLAPAPRDFTEEFEGSLPYWAFLQVDNGVPFSGPSVEAGYLVFDLGSSNQWAYALYGGPDYTDIRLDAKVEVRAGNDGAVGLVCRYSEKSGWYEFNVYSDQTYTLLSGQWLTPGVARYTPLFKGYSGKVLAGTNQLGLLCQGNVLTPYINGVQMRQWQEQKVGLQQGTIGISVSSFQDVPFTAAFDWVKVSEP